MSVIYIIAIAVFFLCCIIQFPLARELRRVIVKRHPDLWTDISRKSFFIHSAILSFARSGRVRDLADPELSRAASRIKWLQTVALTSWLVATASFFIGLNG